MPWYTCDVSEAGPAAYATETAPPVVYIRLTDQGGAFSGQWFYAAEIAKDQLLAVALSALSTGLSVQCAADPPNAAGTPYTEISRLYLIGPS